jgi:hypothetical protein
MNEKISKELLEILACPKCKTSVILNNKENTLTCINCLKKFKIENGIPKMFLE